MDLWKQLFEIILFSLIPPTHMFAFSFESDYFYTQFLAFCPKMIKGVQRKLMKFRECSPKNFFFQFHWIDLCEQNNEL